MDGVLARNLHGLSSQKGAIMHDGQFYMFDVFARHITIGLLLLLAALVWRDARQIEQGKLMALLAISLAGFIAIGTLDVEATGSSLLMFLAKVLSLFNFPLIWLFGLSLFDEQFRFGRENVMISGAYAAMVAVQDFAGLALPSSVAFLLSSTLIVATFGLMGHLLWVVWSGRDDDLVLERRRFRSWFVALVAIAGIVVTLVQNVLFSADLATPGMTVTTVIFVCPLTVWAFFWVTRASKNALLFERQPARKKAEQPSNDHVRLMQAIEQDEMFREPGLTIGQLSYLLRIPEHQLRVLINEELGYRSFANFLNHFRLQYAKKQISDPELSSLPILTIAMDAGYGSVSSFNRSFKLLEGKTPTQFRKLVLSNA